MLTLKIMTMMRNCLFNVVTSCFTFLFSFTLSYGDETLRPPSAEKAVLIEKMRKGNIAAVKALGASKDSTIIPQLAEQMVKAKRAKSNLLYIRALRVSLAKLGDSDSRQEIIRDIDSNARYPQYNAFEDATEIGGNDIVSKLAEKLFDPSPGGRPSDESGRTIEDEWLPAPRHAAVIALSRLIDDPTAPRIDLKKITYNEKHVEKWREWWNKHKSKYEDKSGK